MDAFLPILQRNILALQDERADLLRRLRQIEQEMEIMEAERAIRTSRPNTHVPDFPPEPEPLKPTPEDEVPTVEEADQEDLDHRDFFDNSSLSTLTPGHAMFGPYPGINARLKSDEYMNATLHVVRDWVVNWGRDWFAAKEVIADTGFSSGIVRKRLQDLQKTRIVVHNGKERGGSKYMYNPEMPKAPKTRPRHDTPRSKDRGGAPVPHTRTVGPSGKPGMDKRRARAGKKVKRHRQGS